MARKEQAIDPPDQEEEFEDPFQVPGELAEIDGMDPSQLQSGGYLDEDEEFEVDYTGVSTGYPVYPEGPYYGIVEDIKRTNSRAGNPQYEWTFKITAGEYKNASLKSWTSLLPQALFVSLGYLEALGLAEANKKAKFRKSMVVGKPCILNLTIGEDNKGNSKNNITLSPADQNAVQFAAEFIMEQNGVPTAV